MIIGLAGYAGVGKNAIADILVRDHGYKIVAFADALREMALDIDPLMADRYDDVGPIYLTDLIDDVGWDYAKRNFAEVRRFLQRLGTEGVRKHIGADAWVDLWSNRVHDARLGGWPNIVVPDMRFPNEVGRIEGMYGVTVYVTRPGFVPVNAHISEQLGAGACMYQLDNDGDLERLTYQVGEFINKADPA